MWRIAVVVQSRNVWEIKGASFSKQHVKQSVRWSIFSAELLSDFHTNPKKGIICFVWQWMNNYRLMERRKALSSAWILLRDFIIQNINIPNIKEYFCHSSFSFNLNMQHREGWPTPSLNWIISLAVLSDYNHVDLKTVALDFYTLFSDSIYTICSGLTVFLILHVHANKEIMRYMTLYKCTLFVLWRPWPGLRAARVAPVYFYLI